MRKINGASGDQEKGMSYTIPTTNEQKVSHEDPDLNSKISTQPANGYQLVETILHEKFLIFSFMGLCFLTASGSLLNH